MTIHRIPDEYVFLVNRQRQIVVGLVTFVTFPVAAYSANHEITLKLLGIAILAAFCMAIGRSKYSWAPYLAEEAKWELEPIGDALRFHHAGVASEIPGRDISRIAVQRKAGIVSKITLFYRGQKTCIEHYEGMDALFQHLKKIAPTTAQIDVR